MINPRPNIKSGSRKETKEKLVLVRSGGLFGLVIERAKSEKISINRGITSTPTFVFYSNNTKCLIDYTNQTNSVVETEVEKTFSQVNQNTIFEVYNATYTDPNSLVSANLGGTYRFNSYSNGVVKATVVSGQSLSTNITRYDKTKFDDIPYFKLNTITDGFNRLTIIRNRLGKNTKNSFDYLGVRANDYITITGQKKPIKVITASIDSDGNEYIVLDAFLTEKDLVDKLTKVDVYYSFSDPYTVEPNLTETEVGSCFEYRNGVLISCNNNHTLTQCRFRTNSQNNITTEITLGTFCNTLETDTAVQTTVTENLVQVTSALVSAVANANSVAGPVLKNTNSKNSFYGRPF